jgi:hypothetical protein
LENNAAAQKGGLEDELTVECYEADLDRWTPGPGLPGGNRSQHAAVRVQDRLYVSGGLDHDTVLSSLLGMDFSLFGDFIIEKTTFERRLYLQSSTRRVARGRCWRRCRCRELTMLCWHFRYAQALLLLYKFLRVESKWQSYPSGFMIHRS